MLRIVGAENPGSIERLRERGGREEGREREREGGQLFRQRAQTSTTRKC